MHELCEGDGEEDGDGAHRVAMRAERHGRKRQDVLRGVGGAHDGDGEAGVCRERDEYIN